MTIEVELQIASKNATLPHPSQFREWVGVALWSRVEECALTIRLVDEPEMTELNQKYRKKQGPTNVLSFPADHFEGIEQEELGDIVVCAPVIEREANAEGKELLAHWAHMVVHGTLHLLGHDHQTDDEAEEMESLETEILKKLGFPSPYED